MRVEGEVNSWFASSKIIAPSVALDDPDPAVATAARQGRRSFSVCHMLTVYTGWVFRVVYKPVNGSFKPYIVIPRQTGPQRMTASTAILFRSLMFELDVVLVEVYIEY